MLLQKGKVLQEEGASERGGSGNFICITRSMMGGIATAALIVAFALTLTLEPTSVSVFIPTFIFVFALARVCRREGEGEGDCAAGKE